MNIEKIKSQFPILKQKNRGKKLIYLDNAATSLKPLSVIEAESDFYKNYYGSVHRSVYELGEKATNAFEGARNKVAKFIGSKDSSSIIFTKGATEAINLVADAWGFSNLGKDDIVLITEMEHHANIVPWQVITKRTGAKLDYISIKEDGTLDMESLKNKLTDKVKMLSITQASNVLGTINPLKEIIYLAHQNNTLVMVDGCQSTPHFKIDVQELDCDFFAFSGHKMLGPTGVGVLYGKQDLLEEMEPYQTGGGMIKEVGLQESTWNDIPYKFEAGSPNSSQVIGLSYAIDFINELGINEITKHTEMISEYAFKELSKIDGITIYGPSQNRISIVSFNIDGIHSGDIAQMLDYEGITMRSGRHCCSPLMDKLDISSCLRLSLYIYNDSSEIDLFIEKLNATITTLS
jgi:cysteine desulfurase / selenocysteine lyase|tara:strand:+ start:2801 stop:4015 length:1215 start_codon:yes stop_codon:yes gene_type:complete